MIQSITSPPVSVDQLCRPLCRPFCARLAAETCTESVQALLQDVDEYMFARKFRRLTYYLDSLPSDVGQVAALELRCAAEMMEILRSDPGSL